MAAVLVLRRDVETEGSDAVNFQFAGGGGSDCCYTADTLEERGAAACNPYNPGAGSPIVQQPGGSAVRCVTASAPALSPAAGPAPAHTRRCSKPSPAPDHRHPQSSGPAATLSHLSPSGKRRFGSTALASPAVPDGEPLSPAVRATVTGPLVNGPVTSDTTAYRGDIPTTAGDYDLEQRSE